MAHLALLHDADPVRREQFTANVRALFAELPGTTIGEAHAGPVACLWVAGPRAPISVCRAGDGLAVLAGYAVDDDSRWMTARGLADAWLADNAERYAHDGYHVAVAYDPARGLAAGVDPLGFFPLLYAPLAAGGLIVATSPQVFLAHPDFRGAIDRVGLAGILLTHGLLNDRPLLAGTKRLATGCRLRALPGRPAEERRIFDMRGSAPPTGESFEEARERIDAELLTAFRRHRPAGDDTLLMLSGGLDSRLVAGCLAELGIPTRAVSFGRPQDYEVIAARAVADRLGLPLEVISTEGSPVESFVERGRRAARFGHIASGLGGDDFGDGLEAATTRARFHWSGITLDWVFEPVSGHNGFDVRTGTWSFDRFLAHVNTWGVPVERLAELLGRDGGLLCNEVIGQLELACSARGLPPERASALVRWDQRVRNHLAAALHRTSFTAWPLMPATDRRFFSAVFGLSVPTFADRCLEKAILLRRRPDLAAVPLDSNSFRFEPLVAGQMSGLLPARARAFGARLRRAVQAFLPGVDPRRYERVFNVDQPRWQAVRRAAEPLRPLLSEHLDARPLAAVLLPPGKRMRSRRPTQAGSPIRLLCGLAFALDQKRAG